MNAFAQYLVDNQIIDTLAYLIYILLIVNIVGCAVDIILNIRRK